MVVPFLWMLLLPAIQAAPTIPKALVQTDDGPIQGSHGLLSGMTVFHGVPFAAPPVGDLRWKSPQRPKPWSKPIQTTKPGAICPQFDFVEGFHVGSEDCLYLSVYVPKGCTTESPCPVMQWIYGGAWIIGSNREFGIYDATDFSQRHGVVVVAANYRLDSLGWIALTELEKESTDGSYGNYGLRDQRLAMRWTQRNIHQFGGDPDKVTIFGESAGAWSVCQHLVAPASNRLFSHAIMESGDCDGPWMILDGLNAKRFGDVFATATGCPLKGSSADRVSCLRSLSLKEIMLPYVSWFCFLNKTSNPYCNHSSVNHDPATWPRLLYESPAKATKANVSSGQYWPTPLPPMAPIAGFTAVIDGTQSGLPEVPLRLLRAGKINISPKGEKISVILGTNQDEFALFLAAIDLVIPGAKLPFGDQGMDLVTQHLIQYHDNWNQTTSNQVIREYDPALFKTQSSRITTAGTDFCFRCGTRTAARALSSSGIQTYLYVFDFHSITWHDPASKLCHLDSEVLCGVGHAAELQFLWNKGVITPAGKKMSKAMGLYWTNLAKLGTPNSHDVPVEWPMYNESNDRHLVLANQIKSDSGLSKKFCDFWDSLPRMGPYPTEPRD